MQTEEPIAAEHDDTSAPVWTLPPAPEDWESLFAEVEPHDVDRIDDGTVCTATVSDVDDDGVTLQLASGEDAWCDIEDASLPGDPLLRPGDAVRVLLLGRRARGERQVSISRARLVEDFDRWTARIKAKDRVKGTITQVLRGGFTVEADGLRCFVPGRHSGIPLRSAFSALGKTFEFEVLRLDPSEGRPVLSRKRLAEHQAAEQRTAMLESLTEGEVKTGTVTRIAPFGAFVDIGEGVEGLLHVSEMALHRVEDPARFVQQGQRVKVKIIRVEQERGRIGLSMRDFAEQAQRDRLEGIEVGTDVRGTVRRITDFGAFIEIADGVEGLCHISELSWTERPQHPSDILDVDEEVEVRVLEVRPEEGRISLSLRAGQEDPWARFIEDSPVGSLIDGRIARIENYGIFLEVAEGVEGLCHVSDLTWEGRPESPQDVRPFEIGETMQVRLLECDLERRRLRLGLKHVEGDPWDDAADSLKEGQRIQVRVTRFDEQAAWCEIAPGLEGRLHISQISTERVEHIRSALRIGQELTVMLTRADRASRRIDLSVRALIEAEERSAPRSHTDDSEGLNPLAVALRASAIAGDELGEPEVAASQQAEAAAAPGDDESAESSSVVSPVNAPHTDESTTDGTNADAAAHTDDDATEDDATEE
ncbi:MAG: S1 RNA-binding domain-containing protein, partial [Deltaproteobacteria bacterium]